MPNKPAKPLTLSQVTAQRQSEARARVRDAIRATIAGKPPTRELLDEVAEDLLLLGPADGIFAPARKLHPQVNDVGQLYDFLFPIFAAHEEQKKAIKLAEELEKAAEVAAEEERATKDRARAISEEQARLVLECRRKVADLSGKLDNARRQAEEAQRFEYENRHFFGHQEVDLTDVTPVNHGNLVVHHDPAAPRQAVGRSVWNEENHRRHDIMQEASRKAKAEHDRRLAKFIERRSEYAIDHGNLRGFTGQMPELVEPTWADVVKAGLVASTLS